ncbi:hypothetical protein [Pseudomonas peradeniyensis]|uniref:Uncharacterized protein n=1 Tax=Pseudomonas peradeniyensis TaxID=2745488 RepID=A0ABT2V9K7_9PSED|nr:hypothetical protein [Pseudomonas peradeniyensis]MCU7238355.1 hypothetical protein [Pseudomonas peradeniyensis]
MNDNLHQRLASFSSLDCKVAKRFSDRPTLLDAADDILREQWQQRHVSSAHDPLTLYLASPQPDPGSAWVRPLSQVLVERYCQPGTLNLTAEEDYLTTRSEADPAWSVDIDLHEVELLINESGPLLLEIYLQQLIAYWSRFDSSGVTPWSWYSGYLRNQFQQAQRKATRLPGFARAILQMVHDDPAEGQRDRWANTQGLKALNIGLDLSAGGRLDADMSSAVLIEHSDKDPARNVALLYTLTGRLFRYPSRPALLQALSTALPAPLRSTPRQLEIAASTDSVFEVQALGLLIQLLRLIEHLAGRYRGRLDALAMNRDLDRLTSLIDLCDEVETAQRQALSKQLPDWLRNATSRSLMQYSERLIDVAQQYRDSSGQFWLDGIEQAEAFANRQLAARLARDHPQDTLKPEDIVVTNYQTTASAIAGQDVIITSGEVTPVDFSLAQLAIGNLGLLRPGRVALSRKDDDTLPAWMDAAYLRRLVSELDIGRAYPAMLREKLLNDPLRRPQRQRQLSDQLRVQLPALAMELYLRGQLPSPTLAEHIAQVFVPGPDQGATRWIMRALGLIKAPGSSPDHPLNTWLIEPETPGTEGCLLYRPLHVAPLLYFGDRMALFVAISTAGALQDDLLQRLPAEDRRFYAHGGFIEPHLFVPLDDTSAVPFGTPAPVTLSVEDAISDIGKALYEGCVTESIQRFEAQSATTAQARWESWKELGWLLFNTLLPLAGKTLGKIAWLAQMEVALADFIESDAEKNPTGHELALVNLLVNIALLLFSHALFRLELEQGDTAQSPLEQSPPTLPEKSEPLSFGPPSPPSRLEFGWAHPDRTLNATQRKTLETLQATVAAPALGKPIPNGTLRGLYLKGTRFYTVLDDKVYEVEMAEPQKLHIIGPDGTQGPWLHRDEIGRWQLDLRLGLKGGMPLSEQIRKLRLNKEQAMLAANEAIKADKQSLPTKLAQMATIEKLVHATPDDTILEQCQGKLQALSQFWGEHREHLRARNALEPVKDFRKVHAFALYQDASCQHLLRKLLNKRYKPSREQLLVIARQQEQNREELTPADVQIATQRLDKLVPLLEQMIDNNDRLRQRQEELARLASQRHPQIVEWRDLAALPAATAQKDLLMRFLLLEAQLNRLTLVHGLTSEACYWRDRFWSNFQLGIVQRSELYNLTDPAQELTVRLLRSIQGHFQAAARQLGNLGELIQGKAAQQTLRLLQDELEHIQALIAQDLGNLPDYPPVSSLKQLRNKAPGLIETTEHGLLLAEPRADDENTVDIPGPDSKTPGQTYHLKQGEWVEVTPPSAPSRPSGHSLKRLLKDSDGLITQAQKEVARLLRASDSYLPVEIEESVLHQRDRVLAMVDGIEARLTQDNETDEASQGKDAETVAKHLRELADTLTSQATRMRIEAAVTRKPKMGEVQFLLEQGEARIAKVGQRTRLAKVKGRPDDYIDEYSISRDGQVLWYAHFHYPALDTAKVDFTAGHLKTAAQRHAAGGRYTDASGKDVEVYRAPITGAAAARYFFSLE